MIHMEAECFLSKRQKQPVNLMVFRTCDGLRPVGLSSTTYLPDLVYPAALSAGRKQRAKDAPIARAVYTVIAQNRDEVMVPDNSPSHSMWPYLVISSQTGRRKTISVYAHRGTSRDKARLLYLNTEALAVWVEMGMAGAVIGEVHRPPWNAALSFGIPFCV